MKKKSWVLIYLFLIGFFHFHLAIGAQQAPSQESGIIKLAPISPPDPKCGKYFPPPDPNDRYLNLRCGAGTAESALLAALDQCRGSADFDLCMCEKVGEAFKCVQAECGRSVALDLVFEEWGERCGVLRLRAQ